MFDLAVVGSGIVGLAHANAARTRGLSVVIVERSTEISGATVRNFGHAGFSMHAGLAGEYARVARDVWLELASRVGFWHRPTPSLVVARHADEMELLHQAREQGGGELVDAARVAELAPVTGAVGGMLRGGDIQVDPRAAGSAIARHLAGEGVEFRWRTAAVGVGPGVLRTSRGDIPARAIVVCANHDVDELFPEIAEQYGVQRCALDMLLTDGVGLTMPLLTGSSMLRYSGFATLPAADAVRERYRTEAPWVHEFDINQMYTERPDGTLVVGDTHHLGTSVAPFHDEHAFATLLGLAEELFGRPLAVRQRWQGVYAKAPDDFLRVSPAEGVHVVSVTTGIGMTTGFGLAESVIEEIFG